MNITIDTPDYYLAAKILSEIISWLKINKLKKHDEIEPLKILSNQYAIPDKEEYENQLLALAEVMESTYSEEQIDLILETFTPGLVLTGIDVGYLATEKQIVVKRVMRLDPNIIYN